MRWVILSDDYAPMAGGVAMMAESIAEGLADAGHDVSVYARRRPGLVHKDAYRVAGVGGPSFGRYGGVWLARKAWRDCLQADAIIGMTWPVSTGLAYALQRDVPFHVLFHGSEVTNPPAQPRMFRKVCQRATHRWAVSEYIASCVHNHGYEARVLPIPVSLNVDSGSALPPTPEDWLLVARATPLKGGERFLRIVAAAGARATVVGDGVARGTWEKCALELGIADRVEFRGALQPSEVKALMSDHDLCALLPETRPDGTGAEGLGICLLEAALSGMAVVGCKTGGVPEAVGAGLLLDDPDDVQLSVQQILGWWNQDRGQDCARWVRANHGLARTLACLLG